MAELLNDLLNNSRIDTSDQHIINVDEKKDDLRATKSARDLREVSDRD